MSGAGSWDLSPTRKRWTPSTPGSAPTVPFSSSTGTTSAVPSRAILASRSRTRDRSAELMGRALGNSAKLAALAFVIVVPLSLLGGIVAALNRGKLIDRIITVGGLSATVIPEFVSGIVLILVFAVFLGWLPGTATPPEGASVFTQVRYLILPAICLVLVLFGYIARITRAGVIEALEADYTRTAILKGLPRSKVIRRDVLRNALLPTIAVVATQVGYLIGGLVVVEVLFSYQGIGRLLYDAAQQRRFPALGRRRPRGRGNLSGVRCCWRTSPIRGSTRGSVWEVTVDLYPHGPVPSVEGAATIGHLLGGSIDHPDVGLFCHLR